MVPPKQVLADTSHTRSAIACGLRCHVIVGVMNKSKMIGYKTGFLVWSEEIEVELLKGSFFHVQFGKQMKDKHERELIIYSRSSENARKAAQISNDKKSFRSSAIISGAFGSGSRLFNPLFLSIS